MNHKPEDLDDQQNSLLDSSDRQFDKPSEATLGLALSETLNKQPDTKAVKRVLLYTVIKSDFEQKETHTSQ